MKKAAMHRVFIMAVIAICILASTAFAGKVIFTYDANGQLTDATPAVSNGVSYSYDTAGNLRHN